MRPRLVNRVHGVIKIASDCLTAWATEVEKRKRWPYDLCTRELHFLCFPAR
jgi:hypothetical protein